MPSITTWTRLEPRTRKPDDMTLGLQARVHDPLWLLARQWQLGEFQAEDAGSALSATVSAQAARLTAYQSLTNGSTPVPPPQPYDPRAVPLETLVERERMPRGSGADIRQVVEAGLHFLRLLDFNSQGAFRAQFIRDYSLQRPTVTLDPASESYLSVMAGRVPDGARLYDYFGSQLRPPGPGQLAGFPDGVTTAAQQWLRWYDALLSDRPDDPVAWHRDEMEYRYAVSASFGDGVNVTLVAPGDDDGRLDWSSFDARLDLPAVRSDVVTVDHTVVPAPVRFRGMPSARFWEFEDAAIDYGGIEAGPIDLTRMVLTEFALIYGNDFCLIPLRLPTGSVCRITRLEVMDSFGIVTPIPAYRDVDRSGSWRMFTLDPVTDTAGDASKILFLPPLIRSSIDSEPLEDVLFVRDELAAMAWAIEKTVAGVTGAPISRFEAYQRKLATVQGSPASGLRYRLGSSLPDYWIPLVRVKNALLRPAAVLDPDAPAGAPPSIGAEGQVLQDPVKLRIRDHAIPREGLHVTRNYRYARWSDGSVHLWVGRISSIGKGEGSSGLRFDTVDGF